MGRPSFGDNPPIPGGLFPITNAKHGASTALEKETPTDAIARHSHPADHDVENQLLADGIPRQTAENDPYGLIASFKSEAELEKIKANTSRRRDQNTSSNRTSTTIADGSRGENTITGTGARYPRDGVLSRLPFVQKARARRVQGFYKAQNETIERLLKSVDEHVADARQEASDDHFKVRIAIWGSLAANVILSGLQIYAAVTSLSLSLFTTMLDAIFDPASNIILIFANRAVNKVDPRSFPSGKARLETAGNIFFSFIMTTVSCILVAISILQIIQGNGDSDTKSFHLPSIIAVCVAFGTKLFLFLFTWSIKNKYSQIAILWKDHRNDLFINGFGILTSVGGSKLAWWVDPMGAILLSLLVSSIWLRTAFQEFMLLVGKAAPTDVQQLITYVCVTHDPAIQQIDTVRVYHSGPRLIAEVDVVMDPEDTLRSTHDVAEDLQIKLESLPDIERAYVHVDYETTHKPEHAWKKDL